MSCMSHRSLSRRQFVITSSLALAGGAFGRLPLFAQAPTVTAFEPLRGGVGLFTGRGGAIGWLVSSDAVVVVDTQFPDTAEACLAGLKERSSRPIDLLINTHHHGDHTGGNAVFKPAVKSIVAHANVPGLQRQAAAQAGTEAAQAYADTTFTETWTMDLGRETVSAAHYGPGHTGGDIVVFFEGANIVHMGDLMFNHRHPFIDRAAGASIRNWISSLEKVMAAHDAETTYIFGHAKDGLPLTGGRSALDEMRNYLSAAVDHVRKGIAGGSSRDEITSLSSLAGFEDYAENPPRLTLAGTLGVAYDELTE